MEGFDSPVVVLRLIKVLLGNSTEISLGVIHIHNMIFVPGNSSLLLGHARAQKAFVARDGTGSCDSGSAFLPFSNFRKSFLLDARQTTYINGLVLFL